MPINSNGSILRSGRTKALVLPVKSLARPFKSLVLPLLTAGSLLLQALPAQAQLAAQSQISPKPGSEPLQVFACEPEWKALAQDLGGEQVKVFTATNAFQDPHFIEARPSLIVKMRRADLVVCTGADLEIGWLPLLLKRSTNAQVQTGKPGHFMAADFVPKLEIPHQHDRSMGDIHADGNPHIHLDPRRLMMIAEQLSQRLVQLDPNNAAYYQHQHQVFFKQWRQQLSQWKQQTRALKGQAYFVQHRNWSYLFDWLKLEEVADLEPKPGIPPSSSHLASLLDKVESSQAQGIMIANYQNPQGARWLSRQSESRKSESSDHRDHDKALPVIELPFTVGGSDQATSLISLYQDIIDRLLAARL